MRLRRLGHLNSQLQFRLFFDDEPGRMPRVSAWTETGVVRFESPALGQGLGLPTSEALVIPIADADYLDVEVPGDGSTLRGAFLSTLRKADTLQAFDFAPPSGVTDPFHNLPTLHSARDDSYLYGRVKATLDAGVFLLVPKTVPTQTLEFELSTQPQLAVLSCEILNADPLYPLELTFNNQPVGPVAIHLPDLADPGFQGSARPYNRDVRFQYTGWLRCQRVVPGSMLQAGLNRLEVEVNVNSAPVAIRGVELQLKYPGHSHEPKLVP